MNTPSIRGRNAPKSAPSVEETLFLAMAYDLKVAGHPLVLKAHSLLSNAKYSSFLATLDTMGSQLHEPNVPYSKELYQLAGLFSKYPFSDDSIDRDLVAIKKFQRSEHKCARMNKKFILRRCRFEPTHMQFMRDYIRNIIGDKPNMVSIYNHCDFGPGSAVGSHGEIVDFLTKLDNLTVTPAAKPVAYAALMHNAHYLSYLRKGSLACYDYDWLNANIQSCIVQYNKIVCVPKNAKSNRTIAIEPALNGFVQKGIDLELRSKLNRHGINLSIQSLNKSLARLGSQSGRYATIDLSAASDSISIQLVKELLPPDWFILLNSVRSPSYLLNGEVVRYEKFCSMGNGFCFPLETLIFSAACAYAMSVCTHHMHETFNVYGDDIVIPQGCALLLLEVLHDIGFVHNVDKTFIHGPFRESCGADYYFGENVRPIMLKRKITLDHKIYFLLNQLAKRKLNGAWQKLFQALPMRWKQHVRPYPRDDDTAINVPLDTFMSSKTARWSRDLQTWTWTHVINTTTPGRKLRDDVEVLAGKLRGDLAYSAPSSKEFVFSARFSERTRVARTC